MKSIFTLSLTAILLMTTTSVSVAAREKLQFEKSDKELPKVVGKIENGKQIRYDSGKKRYYSYELDTEEKKRKAMKAEEQRLEKVTKDKELQERMKEALSKGNLMPTTELPNKREFVNPFKKKSGGANMGTTSLPRVKTVR